MLRTPSSFDPFRERVFAGWLRIVLIAAAGLIVLFAPSPRVEHVPGVSGASYPVYEEHRVWRAVGPVLSVRFRTIRVTSTAVAVEVADLLPYFSLRADSSDVHYLLIRATQPMVRLGERVGVYRSWNFRYERGDDGWVNSGYW